MVTDTDRTASGRQLGLWDTVSIILGIVVGAAIFKAPPDIFSNVQMPVYGLAVWLLGGVLCLVGGLCYAELATTYPRSGGDYVYLTRAFGPGIGFLFGWAQLAAVLTGSIGAVSYVFADYATRLFSLDPSSAVWFAIAAIVGLTSVNLLGVVVGKRIQNVLTVTKILGLAGVLLVGIGFGAGVESLTTERPLRGPGFGLAMVLVLYAYGGWNDAVFVTAEVQDNRRNIPRALLIGIGAVTLLYLLVNFAFLKALGFDGIRASRTPAADVLQLAVGPWGSKAISLLVMVSALGAVNGMILTGSRIYATLGADHPLFARLAQWNTRRGSPVWSLVGQAAVALVLILLVGTATGQQSLDTLLVGCGLSPLPWDRFQGGFDTLVAGTATVFWSFFLLTGIALPVLRVKDKDRVRPFPVPLYPVVPIVFCGMCGYMLYASIGYAKWLCLLGVVPLVAGLPLYWLSNRRS